MKLQALCCWLLLSLVGCADSTTPDGAGGETHFLMSCNSEDACGVGLECVCGVCTRPCVTDNSCLSSADNATCEPAGTPNGACVNPEASPVCEVKCSGNSDCAALGDGYMCSVGSCRKLSDGACIGGDGVIYADGDTTMVDCNACVCSDGTLSCDDALCTDGGIDATLHPFPSDDVCTGSGDDDAGVSSNSPLVPRIAPPLCAAATALSQQPGVDIVASGRDLERFAITETDAYWYSWDGLEVIRAELSGGRSWTFDHNLVDVTAFAIDGCDAFGAGRGSEIVTFGIDGSDQRALGNGFPSDTGGAFQVLLDDTHVYITHYNNLFRMPRSGGALQTLHTREDGPSGQSQMVLHDEHIFWIANIATSGPSNAVIAVRKDGQGSVDPVIGNLMNPTAIASDGVHLYVALGGTYDSSGNHNGDGRILRQAISDGPPELVIETHAAPIDLALDARRVYWMQQDAMSGQSPHQSVWKIAKYNSQQATKLTDNAWTFRIGSDHLYWSQPCVLGDTTESFLARMPLGSVCTDSEGDTREDRSVWSDGCNWCECIDGTPSCTTRDCPDGSAAAACALPVDPSACFDAGVERFYYDAMSNTCRVFTAHCGGNGGNANNFIHEADCMSHCVTLSTD